MSDNLQAITPKHALDCVRRAAKATIFSFPGQSDASESFAEKAFFSPRWEPTWRQRADDYEVLHWRRQGGAPDSDLRGVCLAWKRKLVPRRCAQCIPAPAGLEGRIGFVQLK